MNTDELVNHWLISKWISDEGHASARYDIGIHGSLNEVQVITADAGWECGCYSSWTRDDDFRLKAVFQTKSGEVTFDYGCWGDFPSFIEELTEYSENNCYYESDEYREQYES